MRTKTLLIEVNDAQSLLDVDVKLYIQNDPRLSSFQLV